MIKQMKQRLFSICLGLLVLLYAAPPVLAQDDEVKPDAKLTNYPPNTNLGEGSTALSWILFLFLIIIAVGVMKMDAKRSHLD
jgi:hypothetical protein